jgi:hypothetical protein
MPTPENLDQQLDSARDNTLTETNAQTIFENLRKLREFHVVHRRRWIWELLQNAVDATDPSTGRNRVCIQSEQKKIRFSHNGSAFSPEEISHLIYHGSTKQEDPTKKGKFGTGFLAVHLVSRKVRIRGALKVNGLSSDFEFLLDRSGDTPPAIQNNMTEAWAGFKNSRRDTDGTRAYTTAFECDLDADAGAVVQDGLADLAKTVPYVLAFIDKLEEVKVGDDSGEKSWRTVERHSLGDLPILKEHHQPVRPHPLRDGAHHRLVLHAVAEEDVVGEGWVAHVRFLISGRAIHPDRSGR